MIGEFDECCAPGWDDEIQTQSSDSTLPVRLRLGFGSAAGREAQLHAYESICLDAAKRIEELEAEIERLRGAA